MSSLQLTSGVVIFVVTLIYNNKMQKEQPINILRLIFNLLLFALALFVLYAAYQSYQSKQQKAHYDSNIYIQYDSVYQLFAVLYYSHEDKPEQWVKEVINLSLEDISDFCDVIENSQLTPKTDNQIIEGDLVPEYLDSIKIGAVTAVTEFECKERPQ